VTRQRAEIEGDVSESIDQHEAADRVEALEMAFAEMLAKCSWAKREQWCGCVDCHWLIARRTLRSSPPPRRPDPTLDKINEAFKRATRC
jgi:hypothetical protein